MKLCELLGVNFANILRAAFAPILLGHNSTNLICARKMLTPARQRSIIATEASMGSHKFLVLRKAEGNKTNNLDKIRETLLT